MGPQITVPATMPLSLNRNLTEVPLPLEAVAVRDALLARGLENPTAGAAPPREEQRERIQALFAEIMSVLGLDLDDDSLTETPRRVAKMYVTEIFGGLDYRNFPRLTVVDNTMGCDEMVLVTDIDLSSTCEHHFLAIDGVAAVAYIPRDRIIGLSKVNRVVSFFARRPQIQERLTGQVLVALQTLLETEDVAVSITAAHLCVRARGVQDSASKTTTTSLGGAFKHDAEIRRQFLARVERS